MISATSPFLKLKAYNPQFNQGITQRDSNFLNEQKPRKGRGQLIVYQLLMHENHFFIALLKDMGAKENKFGRIQGKEYTMWGEQTNSSTGGFSLAIFSLFEG